jgi:hypothetical protein
MAVWPLEQPLHSTPRRPSNGHGPRRAVQLGERASADPTLASEVEALHEYSGA